ncbi:MAG: hypothetical protein HC854_13750, partial [Flavobacterium sp.]|nr:hypothetical protein [Flavobacterium sp.]
MKNILLSLCLILQLSCKIETPKTEVTSDTVLAENSNTTANKQLLYGPNLPTEPYELKLDMQKVNSNLYDLKIQILLHNNAYYASSNSKKDYKGKFTFFVNATNSFILKNKLVETPLSKENPNGLTHFVNINTTYNQKLEITTKEDFVVGGFIQFTIEPRCTLEKIPVI